jgi:hypothetical protein
MVSARFGGVSSRSKRPARTQATNSQRLPQSSVQVTGMRSISSSTMRDVSSESDSVRHYRPRGAARQSSWQI